MKIKFLSLTLLCFLLAYESGNATRKRISLAPQAGEYSEADIEKEIIFGREMAAIMLANNNLSNNNALNRYLSLVGQSIVRHSNRPELNFHFAAIESQQINAYAMPGGYIFITTAALDLMNNEAELAGVLAHEIAHVTERHIVETLQIRADEESMMAMVSKIISQQATSANVVFYQAIDHAFDILFSKGLAAEDEFRADMQGIFLTAFAGYDVSAYYQYLERISTEVPVNGSQLGSTHPPFIERISRLEKLIANHGLASHGKVKNEKRFTSVRH